MSILVRLSFIIALCSCLSSYAQPGNLYKSIADLGQPHVISFSPKTYQAHPNNYDVVQDKNGIMYFGNLWCVLQYDGTLWRNIYLPHGASCTSLGMDDTGTIFVGGRNAIGYLREDSIGRKHYVSLLSDLPEKDRSFHEIWKIANTPEGVFFSGFEKLFFKPKGVGKLRAIYQTPWYVFHVLNKTYVTTAQGLMTFENNRIVKVKNSDYFNGKFITAMTNLGDQLLIFTSEAGFCLFDGVSVKPWKTPVDDVIRKYNPMKIQNIGEKNIVIATELNGLYIVDLEGNIITHLHKNNGLAANTVSGFTFDQSGLLWLTLYNGVAYVPLFKQATYIDDYAGVTGIPYSTAVYDGKLYLATSEGLFFRSLDQHQRNPRFTRLTVINGLVWNLEVIDDKLFCGQAISSFYIDHGKIQHLYQEGTWMFSKMKSADKMLMGTYSGLRVLVKEDDRWVHKTKLKGFHDAGRSFVIDKFGDVWVTHVNEGVFRLRLDDDRDSVTHLKYFDTSDLPVQNGCKVVRWRDEILFATMEGVYHYDFKNETIMPYEHINAALDSLGLKGVKKIIPVANDSLWVVDGQGALLKMVMRNKMKVVLNTSLLRGDFVSDFEYLNPLPGVALVGTLDGFGVLKESTIKSGQDKLEAYVSRVETNSRVVADGLYRAKGLIEQVPYAENALRFVFASNAYQENNTNQYQYYLEGYSKEATWSLPTLLPVKEYSNLREGRYILHLRTINFENRISDETTLSFIILPPWYRSWWAYTLYALMFIIGNYTFFKYLRRRIEAEKRRVALDEQHRLWQKQKEWDDENLRNKTEVMRLQQEKLDVEKTALEERQQLIEREQQQERQIMEMEKERLEGDLRHKNNELTSLTLHITQKNELLSKINSQLTKTIQLSDHEGTVKSLKEIKASLQKGLSAEAEWAKFTDHFDTVHEGFLKKLKQHYPDLSSATLKLCAFIKMRLSSKQIASLMNTAPDSVLKARYRLRIKFNLDKDTGLEEFLNNF